MCVNLAINQQLSIVIPVLDLPHYILTHRIHVWYIYANMWGILMVNVTIYSIHGSYGLWISHWNTINIPSIVIPYIRSHRDWPVAIPGMIPPQVCRIGPWRGSSRNCKWPSWRWWKSRSKYVELSRTKSGYVICNMYIYIYMSTVYICICICISLSLSLSIYLSIYLSISLSISLSIYIIIYTYVYIYIYIYILYGIVVDCREW